MNSKKSDSRFEHTKDLKTVFKILVVNSVSEMMAYVKLCRKFTIEILLSTCVASVAQKSFYDSEIHCRIFDDDSSY